jgi:hypothetical protein
MHGREAESIVYYWAFGLGLIHLPFSLHFYSMFLAPVIGIFLRCRERERG